MNCKFLLRLSAVILLSVSGGLLSAAERVVTCDPGNRQQHLNCGYGLILVQQVEASHSESDVCVDGRPPASAARPLCSMTPVLNHISTRCNGRYKCTVKMSACHMAKPCRRRCVYMDTTYSCVTGRIHRVCQKKMARLFCGALVIKVLRANYGRTSRRVCRYSAPRRQPAATSCRNTHTLREMARRCDGKHKCSVRVSNHIFSNPCPGTYKYLEYSYTCVHAENSTDEK